jgi:hypothetical protein
MVVMPVTDDHGVQVRRAEAQQPEVIEHGLRLPAIYKDILFPCFEKQGQARSLASSAFTATPTR